MNRPDCLPAALFAMKPYADAIDWHQLPPNATYALHVGPDFGTVEILHRRSDRDTCHTYLAKYVFAGDAGLWFSFVGVCQHGYGFWTAPALLEISESADTPEIVNP